jgi:hypothetical protein
MLTLCLQVVSWRLAQPCRHGASCSALPLEKGRTPVLSAIPWIIDSTTVQKLVIIAIASNITT